MTAWRRLSSGLSTTSGPSSAGCWAALKTEDIPGTARCRSRSMIRRSPLTAMFGAQDVRDQRSGVPVAGAVVAGPSARASEYRRRTELLPPDGSSSRRVSRTRTSRCPGSNRTARAACSSLRLATPTTRFGIRRSWRTSSRAFSTRSAIWKPTTDPALSHSLMLYQLLSRMFRYSTFIGGPTCTWTPMSPSAGRFGTSSSMTTLISRPLMV